MTNEIKIITPIEMMVEHHKEVWLRLCEKRGMSQEEARRVWMDEMEVVVRYALTTTNCNNAKEENHDR